MARDLLRDSFVLTAAIVVSGAMNYLYQIIVARSLVPEQYGVFGSLVSLFYVFLIISRGIDYTVTHYISRLDSDERVGFLQQFFRRILVLSGLLASLLYLLVPHLATFLNISKTLLVVVVVAAMAFELLYMVNLGALKGLQNFRAAGGIEILVVGSKLVIGAGLLFLGYGVWGAIGAILVAAILTFGVSMVHLRRYYLSRRPFENVDYSYRFVVPAIMLAFFINIPTNADVILVKHAFTAESAGMYVSITVMGKVLLFGSIGISRVLFPKISEQGSITDESSRLLRRALVYIGVPLITALIVFSLFPEPILGTVFGREYLPAAPLLPWYAAMVTVFSFSIAILMFTLGVSDYRFVKIAVMLTVLEFGLIYVFGTTLLSVVQIMLGINVLVLMIGVVIIWEFLKGNNHGEAS